MFEKCQTLLSLCYIRSERGIKPIFLSVISFVGEVGHKCLLPFCILMREGFQTQLFSLFLRRERVSKPILPLLLPLKEKEWVMKPILSVIVAEMEHQTHSSSLLPPIQVRGRQTRSFSR